MHAPLRAAVSNRADSRIALTAAHRLGRTRRIRVYEDGAWRVRFPHGSAETLNAVLVNTAGGIAGGDRLAIELAVEHGGDLTVCAAAAEKVYRASGAASRVGISLRVAAGAQLRWLPQETILFDGAELVRNIAVDLAADAFVLIAEAVVFGRAAMGETVRAGALTDRWRVRRGGRLVFADSIRLTDDIAGALAPGAVANGHTALATLLMTPADDSAAARLRERQSEFLGEAGVSAWNGLLVARFVAASGAALRHDLALALAALDARPAPRLWLN